MSDAVTVYATTSYIYDQLGNLTEVNQGAQQRSYVYDSVSRLREAFNPEQVNSSGVKVATRYDYDDASNLIKRTNPNSTFVSYSYDGLNRVATKTLSTGGVWVYGYDTGENCKGRLVSVVRQGTSEGMYYDGYDALGRVSASRQVTDGTAYRMSYGYDLAGNVTSQFYPSGREVRTSYDAAGRLTTVSRYTSGVQDRSYVTGASYTAQGAVSQMILGNGLRETTTYNSRLQAQKMELRRVSSTELMLGLDYGYGGAANNGNLISQTIRIGATQISQSYTYDALNRLKSATEAGGWSQTYEYDRYGNRAVAAGYVPDVALTPQSLAAFEANTNRLMGSEYDESGNQLQDQAARTFGYDAENRQVSFNSGAATYSYDGDGRRVKKVDGTGTTIFVYNAMSQLIAEYSTAAPAGAGGTSYLTQDHLGSTRVVTDQSGNVKARYDYLPFGEEIPANVGGRSSIAGYAANDSTRQRFTSKERDNESGLDYFLARYYSSAQGRFTSPDEFQGGPHEIGVLGSGDTEKQALPYADIVNPQSLNRYQYVLGNPLKYIDPDGHQDGFSIRFQTRQKQLANREITEEQYWERLRGEGVGVAVGLAVVGLGYAGPRVGAAILMWAARNPDKVQQIGQEMVQASTGSPAPTPRLGPAQVEGIGREIGQSVRNIGKGQMTTIAAKVTERGLSQADAVSAVQTAIKTVGKGSIPVAQADGSVVVASVRVGANQPVLIVNQSGQVIRGTATINAGIRNGKEFFEVKNVKPIN